MSKNAGDLHSVQIFTRTTPQMAKQLESVAGRYRVSKSDYLRWLVEDAVSGKYTPSHLTDPVTAAEVQPTVTMEEKGTEAPKSAGWRKQ